MVLLHESLDEAVAESERRRRERVADSRIDVRVKLNIKKMQKNISILSIFEKRQKEEKWEGSIKEK